MAVKPYYTHGKALREREFFTSTVQRPTGLKRYFSTIDAEIYFGEEYMDDIVRLDYSIEERKLPIYGFNSFYPSKIVVGQKIIQGTFAVNFTKTGHVTNIIKKISKSVYAADIEELSYINCSEKNKPLWDKSFDMLIGYGYYKHPIEKTQTYNATCKCLIGCILTGMQEVLDTSGEPVMEVYSFIAKDLVFKDFSEIERDYDMSQNIPDAKESEIYLIENIKNGDRVSAMWEYCKNNPSTLGIAVDLKHNIKNVSKPEIIMDLSVYNDRAITIRSANLTITDQRVKSATVLHLNKVKGFTFAHKFNTENMQTSKSITNVLKGEVQQQVSCRIELEILLEDGNLLKIKYDMYIYKGLGY